jgi:hypothetical protein
MTSNSNNKSSYSTAQKLSWTDDDLMEEEEEEEEKFNSEWDDDVDDDDDEVEDVLAAGGDSNDHDQEVLHETAGIINPPNHIPTSVRPTVITTSLISPTRITETPTPSIPSSQGPQLFDGKLKKFVGSSNSVDNGNGGSEGVAVMTATSPRVLLTSMSTDMNDSTPLLHASNIVGTPLSSSMEEGDFEDIMRERNRVSNKSFLQKYYINEMAWMTVTS